MFRKYPHWSIMVVRLRLSFDDEGILPLQLLAISLLMLTEAKLHIDDHSHLTELPIGVAI